MAADRPFVLQWRSTVFASSLPSTAKLVLLTLAEFADRNGANCWPSLPMIAKRASLNERSVRRALDDVEPLGWIQRSKKGSERGWALSVYRLTIPDGADTGSTPQDSTSGLSVTEVRTLCHSGVDTESNYLSSELSNTHPEENSTPEKRVSQKRGAKAVPYQEIVDLYNRTMIGLPNVLVISKKRMRLMKSAWEAAPDRGQIPFWEAYFAECQDDPFYNGTGPYREPHANWRPDFDYLIKEDVVTKVYERAMDRMKNGDRPTAEAPRRHSAADDFRGKKYTGTPIDQLPADLREAARDAMAAPGPASKTKQAIQTLQAMKAPRE